MAMDSWEDVAGKECEVCGGYATHIWGTMYICCACHIGCEPEEGLIPQSYAKKKHDEVLNG